MSRIRMICWYACGWGYLALSTPMLLRANYLYKRCHAEKNYNLSDFIMRRFAKLLFCVTGSKITLVGEENIPKDRAVLFVSNHQGHMDSLVIQGYIKKPKGYVTILAYQKAPILGKWMKYIGCVFLDRQDKRKSLNAINEAIQNLKNGRSMVVFPEGKLSDGSEILEFEKGWLRLAKKSGVPIVPVTLKDTYKIISYSGKKMYSAKVQCIISEPVETQNIKREEEKEFVQQIKNIILAKL